MRRVLVTGANGFVGKNIPRHLISLGCEVHLLGRTNPEVNGAMFHSIDLLSLNDQTFRDVSEIAADTLIHVAWCTEPGTYWTSIDNLRWAAASLSLVDAFLTGGGKRITVAGTCAEYDWNYHTLIEAKTPLNPFTIYGETKASLHAMLASYAQKHEISFAWGHIFFPYGPHEKRQRLLSDLVCNLLSETEIEVSEGRQVRDFMHVDDVARAFVELAKSDVQGAVNIASGDSRQLREIIELVANATGRLNLVKFGARRPIENDPPCLTASVARLHNEVGFVPSFTLEEGIRHTVLWWKSQQAASSRV